MSQSITFGDLDNDKRRELEEHALKILEDPRLWPFRKDSILDYDQSNLTCAAYMLTVCLNKIQDLASSNKIKQTRTDLEEARSKGIDGRTNDGKGKKVAKQDPNALKKGKTDLGIVKVKGGSRQRVITMFCLAGLDKVHINYLNLPDKQLIDLVQAKYAKVT